MSKLQMGDITTVLLAMSRVIIRFLKVFTSLFQVRYTNLHVILFISLNHLIISTPTVFTTHPQDQFVYNNEDAVFECAANGSESLMINWTRNDEHILFSHFYKSNGTGRSILKVNKATVDDSGIYQCITTNANDETIMSEPVKLLSKTVNRNGK